jgi:hypothetical protein
VGVKRVTCYYCPSFHRYHLSQALLLLTPLSLSLSSSQALSTFVSPPNTHNNYTLPPPPLLILPLYRSSIRDDHTYRELNCVTALLSLLCSFSLHSV